MYPVSITCLLLGGHWPVTDTIRLLHEIQTNMIKILRQKKMRKWNCIIDWWCDGYSMPPMCSVYEIVTFSVWPAQDLCRYVRSTGTKKHESADEFFFWRWNDHLQFRSISSISFSGKCRHFMCVAERRTVAPPSPLSKRMYQYYICFQHSITIQHIRLLWLC